jgi:bifunctional non-homologous end joining protein LigD
MAGLSTYKAKRRFGVTAEPKGKVARKRGHAFVIQKHDATRLHYDLRLELDGVMKSWAVTRGPSLVPGEKRLAVQVEDHPIEYNKFEGIIPEGEYGGGTVMIWDRGTWEPEVADVDAALKKGDLKFSFHGEKLEGSWVFVRLRPRGGDSKPAWLLIKHRDAHASTKDIAVSQPRSVVSGRILTEIARDEGGDIKKAATGDPPAEVRKLLKSKDPLERKTKGPRRLWHSRPRGKS